MSVDTTTYRTLQADRAVHWLILLLLCSLLAIGLYCAHSLEQAGHQLSGMTNRVVWGLPHVFAIGLIVGASGALNGASLSSVFGVVLYKSWARFSVVLAISLLLGGLIVLVLDLGRPDRLIVALTHWNFRSIFAWNIFLYSGFVLLGMVYLWMLMERRYHHWVQLVGRCAFVWRLMLTTGTGCIFGFLVGRNALDSALLAPLFISLSLLMGTAIFMLVLIAIRWGQNQPQPLEVLRHSSRLLFWFIFVTAYFTAIHHLANLYVTEHHSVEAGLLKGGFAKFYWLGYLLVGSVLPLVLLWRTRQNPCANATMYWVFASVAVIVGGMALIYHVVIGSQLAAQQLFPGMQVISSSFGDAGRVTYVPSGWELGLGLGGVGLSLMLCLLACRVLPLIPLATRET